MWATLSPVRALVLTLAVLALGPGRAAAAKGRAVLLNCVGKVRLCVYDKSDVIMKYPASVGDSQEGVITVTCNSDGGCKVKVQRAGSTCTAANDETSIVGATTLDEAAYRLRKDGPDHYTFDKMSNDQAYFDGGKHRSCTATKRVGEPCGGQGDCIDGSCNTSVKGGKVCCKVECGQAACQSCSERADGCAQTPYGQNGQFCEQSWQMCDGRACVWRASVANGKPCKGPLECKSGFCADGVCCDAKCDGACVSCGQSGKGGTCSPIARGQADVPACIGVCDGAGKCALPSKARCRNDSECLSGHCDTQKIAGQTLNWKLCR